MLCFGPHRNRLLFNLGAFRPHGSHVLPERLQCRFGWHFAPNCESIDSQVKQTRWTEFFRGFKKTCEYDFRRKVRFEFRPYFFGAKLIALKKPDGGLRPITVGNFFHRLSAKCAGYHVFESRQARYVIRQVVVGFKRGAELASHVFRCLIEIPLPKENVILRNDFENASNLMNRQLTLAKNLEINPEVY